jgi:hypothetical protein
MGKGVYCDASNLLCHSHMPNIDPPLGNMSAKRMELDGDMLPWWVQFWAFAWLASSIAPTLFHWYDPHWVVNKAELKMRVRVWNKALEMHCDELGLESKEWEHLAKKHVASPFAPCGNISCCCKAYETKIKRFNPCSKCKLVAYCSEAEQ